MRRFITISLLLLFTLPLVSPLFAASTADENMPICCRRNGKHHCIMAVAARPASSSDTKTKTASLHERCPYSLASFAAANLPFTPGNAQPAISASKVSSTACLVEIENCRRLSVEHSHQKRGPPALVPSHS